MRLVERPADAWAVITDVHGAAGTSGWWQLVPGHALRGPWEAIELARLPAGGVSGVHRHTRTHEVYFVLSGPAEFLLDGASYPMPAGHVAVTARGQSHGLRAPAGGGVEWLVAEVPVGRSGLAAGTTMEVGAVEGPVDLDRQGTLTFAGAEVSPLQAVGLLRLAGGESHQVDAEPGELFMYLVEGTVLVRGNGAKQLVAAGSGLTFGWRERGTITATGPARLFWVRAGVDEARL